MRQVKCQCRIGNILLPSVQDVRQVVKHLIDQQIAPVGQRLQLTSRQQVSICLPDWQGNLLSFVWHTAALSGLFGPLMIFTTEALPRIQIWLGFVRSLSASLICIAWFVPGRLNPDGILLNVVFFVCRPKRPNGPKMNESLSFPDHTGPFHSGGKQNAC